MKNTGKDSEKIFIETMGEIGCHVHRMRDASDLHGINKKKVAAFPCPADFLVVRRNYYELAEVKSISNGKRFSYSNIRPAQRAAAKIAAILNAPYNFYIHDLIDNKWYILSAKDFIGDLNESKKSRSFEELQPCLLKT